MIYNQIKELTNELNLSHLPSALSQADIVECLMPYLLTNKYKFICGKYWGAQSYFASYFNITGIRVKNLRELPFIFQQNLESIGDILGFATGVSLGSNQRTICFISDAQLQSGYVYEAMNFIIQHNLNISVLVDFNKLQVCDRVENIVSVNPFLKAYKEIIEFCDGHNQKEIKKCLERNLNSKNPRIIIFNTIKGKGFKELENNTKVHYSR